MITLPKKSAILRDLLSQKLVTLPAPKSLAETRKVWNLINPVSQIIEKMGLVLISSGHTYFLDGFESFVNDEFTTQDYLLTAKVLTELNEFENITYAIVKERLMAQFNLYLNSENDSKEKVNNILITMLPEFFEKNLNAIRLKTSSDLAEKNNKQVVFDEAFKNIINVWLQSFKSSVHKSTFEKLLATLFQKKTLTAEEYPVFFTSSQLRALDDFWEKNQLLRKSFAIEITPAYIWLMNGTPSTAQSNTTVLSKVQRAGVLVANTHRNETLSAEIIREYMTSEFDLSLSKQESIDSYYWLKNNQLIDNTDQTTRVIERFDITELN